MTGSVGIWDSMSSQECVNFIRLSLYQRKTLQEICEDLLEHCLNPHSADEEGAGNGRDNMTVMLVALLQGQTLDQWHEMMVDRVEKRNGYHTPREFHKIWPVRYPEAAEAKKDPYISETSDLVETTATRSSETGTEKGKAQANGDEDERADGSNSRRVKRKLS